DIGDEQSLQQSLSTFSGHIKNISQALRELEKGALTLFDEIGAGTDPAEGAALAKAILKAIKAKGAIVLASTHYGELKAFAYEEEGFANAAMEFDPKSLRPTYRLIMGAPGASHALRIAERYGIPKDVVEEAKEALGTQHQEIAAMIEKLEHAQRQARTAQGEADRRLHELRKAEERANKKLAEAEEIRRTVHSRASAVIEEALREIRLEAQKHFDELKGAVDAKSQSEVRSKLKELQEVGQSFAEDFKPRERKRPEADPELVKGMSVKIQGYSQVGTVLEEPKGGSTLVQMGPLKLTVKTRDLSPVKGPTEPKRAAGNVRLQKAQSANTELHLRAMRAEEAMDTLERFLDDAVLAGLPQVRIIHGKGEGILRKLTQDLLRRYPAVKSFREGEPGEGGHGATVVVFD
ncbi:MAG TPA: Smr/MutS family protein, partial [Fimbriimonadaceae bacterium]|nr:Smr/MutS family protein [Fimbriimonadaceae bacterium]